MGNNYAFFLSIDKYADIKSFPEIPSCVNDAVAISQLLKYDYGFKCRLKANNQCTKRSLIHLLSTTLPNMLSVDDSLFLYFSGHGFENYLTNQGFFVPYDAKKNNESSYISLNEIIYLLKEHTSAGRIFIAADICNAGYLLRTHVSDRADSGRLVYVLASGLAGQDVRAIGPSNHSPFAYALLEALGGLAGIGKEDSPHSFNAKDLSTWVQRRVLSLSPNQISIAGYLARDPDSGLEFEFTPPNKWLPPHLVKWIESDDCLIISMAISELIRHLGFKFSGPSLFVFDPPHVQACRGTDIIRYKSEHSRLEWERDNKNSFWEGLDKKLHFYWHLKEPTESHLVVRNEANMDKDKAWAAMTLILRLVDRRNAYMSEYHPYKEDLGKIQLELAKIVARVGHISICVNTVREFNLKENASETFLFHLNGVCRWPKGFLNEDQNSWHKELIKACRQLKRPIFADVKQK